MMNNLQSSAFVAKTTQLLSSVARLRLLLVMFLTLTVSAEVWGETTATLTLSSSKKFGTTSGSTLTDDKNNTWTCTGSAIQNTYNTTYKGQQFGTSKNAGNYTFTCTIAGATISSVKITAAAGSTSAKYSISVGGNSKYSGKLSKTSTTYGGTSASGSGEISISLQGSGTGAAVYLGSITVIYTTTSATKYTVTFSAGSNGTCSTTSLTETSAGAGVTLPDVTPNSGYRFLGWATTNSATTADAGTAGETYKPASNITLYAVYKQQCTITWLVDGNAAEGYPTTKVDKGGKVTTLPTTPTLDCSGRTFVGWSNQEVTDGNKPSVLFTTAENSPAITEPTTFHAVFATKGSNQTATFDAATISGLTKSSSSLTWTHNTSGIELYLSAGQRYTSGTPNTFTVTSGTSNYCQLSAPTGIVMSKVVATLSGANYKINSVSTPWTLSTSSTIQTISSTNGSDYLKMSATSSYQIRITQLVVTYAIYSDYTTTCTTETLVSLDPNGGTGGTPSVTATKGEAMPTLITLPTRTGYTFQGYFTAASGGTQYYNADGTSAKDWDKTDETFTLYAQWECDIPEFTLTSTTFARTEGQEIRIASNATNVPANAKFTWYLNGAEVANQSSSELYIASCTIADAGNYTCTISYDDCSFNSTNNYSVKIYSVRGLKEDWNTLHPFTSTSETEGEFSIYLDANTSFKVWDGEYYYGNPESGTMSGTSENWTMQQNKGGDVTMSNVIAGTYTFKLDYSDAANTKISVYYPEKKIVYFNPGDWSNSKYAVYSWEGEDNSTVLMTKVDDCTDRNIYQAEIDASHNNVIFIGGNASYDVSDPWNNVEHKTIDLTYPSDDKVLFDRTQANTTHLFLTPNNYWKQDNPRYAAYFFGNGEIWSSLSYNDKENIYYCKKISGYPSVIFCRMNPSTTENNWDNKWNQSSDLSIPTDGTNHYTVKDNTWDKGGGTWSTVNGDWTAFTPNYTVTFDANGHGTAPDAQCVAKNGKATTPAAPTATGYTFDGWYTDQACNNAWDFENDVVTSDITLYAKWTANIHTLTWDVNGGNALTGTYTSGSVAYGTVIVPPTTPTRTGHTFLGWKETDGSTTVAETMPDKDLTYTAQWKFIPTLQWSAPTCTVTIASESNVFPTLTATPDAIKSGVKFESSEPTVATINANGDIILKSKGTTTIKAYYEEDAAYAAAEATYELTVVESTNCRWEEVTIDDIEYGDEVVIAMKTDAAIYAMSINDDDTATPEATIVTPSNFATDNGIGVDLTWYIEKDVNGKLIIRPKKDITKNVYCNTSADNDRVRVGNRHSNHEQYKTFEIDGNYLKNSSVYYIGVNISKGQWWGYANNSNIPFQTLKFYKKVCLPEGHYRVTWDANGGQWSDGSTTKEEVYAEGATINKPDIPKRDGYEFTEWAPNPTTMPDENTTFAAQWAELHTITWLVGSNSVLTEKVANTTGVTQTPDDPANNAIGNCANAFMGWSETPLGSTEGQSAPADLCTAAQMKSKHTSVTGDKTFYAVFATTEGSATDFKRVTSLDELSDGTSIVIASTKSSKFMTYSTAFGSSTWSESNGKITATDNMIFTLVANGDTWKIQKGTNVVSYEGRATSSPYCKPLLMNSNIKDWILVQNTSTTNTFTFYYEDGDYDYSIEYYPTESNWYAYSNRTPTSNDYYALALYVPDVTYSNYVTNCCALAPATNLTVSGTTANSATLTWTAPSPTTGITKLQVRNAETNDIVVDDIAVNTTTATITGLEECISYQYYVVSVGDCEVVSNTVTATPFSGAKTVNYDYNGGTGSPASFTTSCDNQKIYLPTPTRPGYTFDGWYDSDENFVGVGGAEYNPTTSPVTLYAHWTETIYKLTHSGSNYTNTENKTSIKSSETPFTLHYTCTGDYGLPATISITGGGKSWTVGTDYTWEVAADRQSATLVIKETVISADVTITINVATRYTVTFVHNDKGVFSGSETLEVLSSENTITLPTVTDVSCGFYDTFEGWIVADEDYTESTSKPAGTIYKGGANYTVNSDCTLRALYSKCEGDNKEVYVKVIENLDDWSGTYLIVNETNNVVMDGSKTTETGLIAQNNCQNITINNNQIESNNQNDTYTFTIAPHTTTSGKYSIKSYSGYYIGSNSASNTINATTTESTYSNSITITDGILTIGCGKYKDSDASKEYRLMYMHSGSGAPIFKYYPNTQGQVCLYKKGTLCTKYYSTNPSCEKPVGVYIFYHANAVDANMSCERQRRTYKVENEENKYPQLASQLQFCTNATREGYTLVGWNTQANGQGTTYNINQNYYNLPVSGELDVDKWITLNLYAMWKPCIKFNLGNATGGTGVPDAVVENGECVLPEPTAEQLGTIPCGYEFYAWSETSVNATQTKPALFMPGDTYTGSALTLYAVYRLCEIGSNPDLFSLSYTISDTKYYVGPVTRNQEGYAAKFTAITDANNATVFGMKSIEGKTYKSLYWMNEETKEYMYWKDNGASFTFTSEEDDSYGWTISGTTTLTFLSTPYMTNGSRYLSADASEIGCPSEPKAVTQFTKEMASTTICTYATEPECSTTATLQFVTNGGTLNYPTTYDANSYQNLTPGSIVYLPTATFAGEWTFEGWMKDAPLESQNLKPETVNFIEVDLNITTYSASKTGTTTFYAVYSKTNDDKQFDPVNGGTYKLFAIGADGTKTYMPIWSGGRGTLSGVTTCAETGDYTITPGTGTHAGHYQITCGEHTLGVVGDISQTDLNEVEGTWWNINPSTSGKGTWRITVVGSSERALSALSNSFGNYALTQLNNDGQPQYRDMEIGECIYTEYTSTPENIPYITITGAPVKITSTNGERVYAPTTLHIEAHNFTGERIIHLSATNGFGVDPVQVRTNGQGAYSGDVKVYYEPTTDGDGQTFTTSVLTASQTGGTNAEKISQTFAAIQGRNMPANFVIAAKWDGHWYALPANCTSSLSSTEGLLIEVDEVDNPTVATAAPASAKYGLREVIPSRQTDYGQGIVFTERFAEGDKQFALYNGSNANIQVNAQYTNYSQTNPDKYEWIPSTSDFKDYTLTNASTGRNLGLTSGTFGAYTAASNQVRLLPATFYEPAPVQVLKWKENSVIVMYTGAEATATTQVGDNDKSTEQALANQQLTHGIYELTTNQALTDHAGGELNIYIGTNTRVELEIPLIISGEVTASANAHDVVILENSKLTAAETKYSYKDVYVYGGAKLAIPDGAQLGVNNIILRAGGVATNGAGKEATYQYIYPQVELKGTLTSSVQNIRYEYVTDYDHWYHLVLPFDGSLTSIHYPTEYYGDQVKLDNTGSWQIKRYAGEIRATGNYDAWKDIEKDEPKATIVTAGKGYIFWGAPKKITVNDKYDRPTWGIQRITMLSDVSETISKAKDAENADKTISGLGSYKNVANNSGADNDQGWNLIGNPYMVNLTGLNSQSLQIGQLIHETDASGNWTGKWQWDNTSEQTGLRYVTIPSDHFETYEAKPMTWFTEDNPMIAGRSFFVQIAGDATDLVFDVTKKAALVPALLAENNDKPVDIETGIVLSNETLQDEVNFWIKAGKTNDYEYNADYPKTPNNNHFNIYGVHTNGDLSWVATGPEYAAESMPIGYQVPAAGTYMLSLTETYDSNYLEALYVTDHEMSPEVTTDLMITSYEFSVNQAETNNKRFTVAIKLKNGDNNDATGLDNLGIGNEHLMKFIYQDKIYILHHGVIYDATGKRVITINK